MKKESSRQTCASQTDGQIHRHTFAFLELLLELKIFFISLTFGRIVLLIVPVKYSLV